jgi:hypothetical protein
MTQVMRIKFREKWDETKGGEAVDLVNFESQRSKNKSEYSKIKQRKYKNQNLNNFKN